MDENELFESAMKGRWDEVVEAYAKDSRIQEARITKSDDTALHVAVSNGETEVVFKLLEIIGENASKILTIKNERGNTPLHIAAALGNADLCHCMAMKQTELICFKNLHGETPLFLSALHGRQKAFLCLHFLYHQTHKQVADSLCTTSNTETILCSAISGEYFSLAFQIICKYPNLVNSVNQSGLSPLHILASKPHAFKSGSTFGLFDRLIYSCIIVDKLEEETYNPEDYINNAGVGRSPKYPENYESCVNFFRLIRASFRVLSGTRAKSKSKSGNLNDEENPQKKSRLSHGTAGASTSGTNNVTEELPDTEISRTSSTRRSMQINGNREDYDHFYPPNYSTAVRLVKLLIKGLLVILGIGIWRIQKIKEKKERHTWATQVMNELVQSCSLYKHCDIRRKPQNSHSEKDGSISEVPRADLHETPILIAAKMGTTEIVEKILDTYPVAIQDLDANEKNIVLLAVEHRQTHVYKLLMKRTMLKESLFRQLDNKGNSALHLAAKFGEYRPWLIPGAALQMQWEIKWFRFVRSSMPRHFFVQYNKEGQTPKEIFTETHKELVASGREWLTKTSESCSVVAALIATVAFETSAAIPGGVDQDGVPTLEDKPAFGIFAISSLAALCFSVTALVFFLTILTSRYQEKDFAMDLPRKLLLGLSSLFTSIASILVSFCAGHFFLLKDNLRNAAYPMYAATCLPVSFFFLAQLPLYFDLIRAIYKKVPQPSYKQ